MEDPFKTYVDEQNKYETESSKTKPVENGVVFDLAKVDGINSFINNFGKKQYIYKFENVNYYVPPTLHSKLVSIVKNLGKVKAKITKDGEGLETTYDAVPIKN